MHKQLYEKNIERAFIKATHTVRILLNSDRESLEQTLKHVPYDAKVTMINSDDELEENYGEIIFIEEIQSE
jgi:hypothetical protein